MLLTEGLQAIVIRKELKLLVHYDAVLEAVIVLAVSVVAQYPELYKLSCSGLCLVVVEEEAIVVVVYPLERFVHQYSYMEGAQEYAKVPRKLMISEKVIV